MPAKAKLLVVTCWASHGKWGARYLHVLVYLVGAEQGGDVGPVLSEFRVPGAQVLVCHLQTYILCAAHETNLSGGIKHHDASMGLVVVRAVHGVEALLSGGVPEVYEDVPGPDLGAVPGQEAGEGWGCTCTG